MMGLLEDSLRETFAGRVAATPALENVADRAMTRARETRRRRTAFASLAAVLTVALGVAGVGLVVTDRPLTGSGSLPWSAPSETTSAPLVGIALPVDVLNQDRIQVADGRVLSVADLGAVQAAWRVRDGWLVQATTQAGGGGSRSAVWLVEENGRHTQVVAGDATMVSPGSGSRPGAQIAWVSGDTLTVGTYDAGEVMFRAQTQGIGALRPRLFVGGGVLLGATVGGDAVWDMWFPDRGAYKATVDTYAALSEVVGTSEDGSELIGLYGDTACLGIQATSQPGPYRMNCEAGVRTNDRVYVSPNAGWWAVRSADGITLYAASAVWPGAPAVTARFAQPVSSVVWSGTTVVAITGTQVVSLSVPALATSRSVRLPDAAASGPIALIDDLR